MTAITASMVKELRDKSGAGMMDCKKALAEVDGDVTAAIDWLRTKGLATAQKKSARVATDGLVAVAGSGTQGAVVEVNAETDFVARNEIFQNFVSKVAELAMSSDGNMDNIKSADFGTGKTVDEQLTENIATIGENQTMRRVARLSVDNGVVTSYVHNAVADGLGKIGVLVALESTGDAEKLTALGRQVAMHVAAVQPQFLDRDSVDPAVIEREKAVLTEQARESGKPDDIIEKMIVGRINKFYEEICLMEQTFVMDGETKVGKVIENAASDVGAPVKLVDFVRFTLGEGLEKKEDDFAAEVAEMAKAK